MERHQAATPPVVHAGCPGTNSIVRVFLGLIAHLPPVAAMAPHGLLRASGALGQSGSHRAVAAVLAALGPLLHH